MALGRALRNVLIIDDNKPCNRQTPSSHNFITHDGHSPAEIVALARWQVKQYQTVDFFEGVATRASKGENGFDVWVESGRLFTAKQLIFATGIRDIMPALPGFDACWGISVLHCPYCHGYEIRNEVTAILGNGDLSFDLARLISNWTNKLTLFTNGFATFKSEQRESLENHGMNLVEKEIERLEHHNGYVKNIIFKDGSTATTKAIYAPVTFEQHCSIPESLGCQITSEGYIQTDPFQETTVKGVFACGDNVTRMRTVANAVGMGTTTGMIVSKKLIIEKFQVAISSR